MTTKTSMSWIIKAQSNALEMNLNNQHTDNFKTRNTIGLWSGELEAKFKNKIFYPKSLDCHFIFFSSLSHSLSLSLFSFLFFFFSLSLQKFLVDSNLRRTLVFHLNKSSHIPDLKLRRNCTTIWHDLQRSKSQEEFSIK